MANKDVAIDSEIALLYDPVYLEHLNPPGHPECSDRLTVTYKLLKSSPIFPKLKLISPCEVTADLISAVHDGQYVDYVQEIADSGGGYIDSDTYISPDSYRAARFAAGAIVSAVDNVMNEETNCVFCLVRPPGHHAEAKTGMGFCIFNNLAVGAQYALEKYGLSKVLIIDWDAHHGNGIQDIFYNSQQVLYVSLHQYPLYPGTGALTEIGRSGGKGYTANIPLPPGSGNNIYLEAFSKIIGPMARQFNPEIIMIAAGYDGHFADPLTMLDLSTSGYIGMTEQILSLMEHSKRKIIFSLEGGYNLEALSYSVLATICALTGNSESISDPFGDPGSGVSFPEGKKAIDIAARQISNFWEL